MAVGQQRIEGFQQSAHIVCVQAGSRFVEDKHHRCLLFVGQKRGQFDPLIFAARQGTRRLSEFDVANAHGLQRQQAFDDAAFDGAIRCGKKVDSLIDRHFEHIKDILPTITHLQHIVFETLPVARLALQHQIGHKLHRHGYGAFALTFGTTSAILVEREIGRRESHLFGQRLVGKEFANLVVRFDVGYGVGAGRFADRTLADKLDIGQQMHTAIDRGAGHRQR